MLSLSCDPPYFYNGVIHWGLGSPMRLGNSQGFPSSFPRAGIVSLPTWWTLLFTNVGAGKSNSDPHACIAGTVPTEELGPVLTPSYSTKHAVFRFLSTT